MRLTLTHLLLLLLLLLPPIFSAEFAMMLATDEDELSRLPALPQFFAQFPAGGFSFVERCDEREISNSPSCRGIGSRINWFGNNASATSRAQSFSSARRRR
jgi:hypothetical protein